MNGEIRIDDEDYEYIKSKKGNIKEFSNKCLRNEIFKDMEVNGKLNFKNITHILLEIEHHKNEEFIEIAKILEELNSIINTDTESIFGTKINNLLKSNEVIYKLLYKVE